MVNVHAFADQLEAHLARRRSPEILISDERAALLETGGGLKQARAAAGRGADLGRQHRLRLDWKAATTRWALVAAAWDPARMDAC